MSGIFFERRCMSLLLPEGEPVDQGVDEVKPSSTVQGSSGNEYQNVQVADPHLGTTDHVVPDGPSIP